MNVDTKISNEILEIDGILTQVMRKGQGEPLLWLHGANGNREWSPFLEELSLSFEVIAPEHPGFGASQRPVWMKDFEDLVYHYRALLDYLEIEKVNIVGQSLGGWLAAEFAINQTHRVDKLVLTAATGLRADDIPKIDTFLLTQEELAEQSFYNKQLVAIAKEKILQAEEQEAFLKHRTTQARYMWERPFNPKFQRLLKWIDVPTLIIWGEEDRIIPAKYAQRFTELIPHSQIKLISECGHLPYVEKKDEYVQILIDFLKD